MLFPEVKLGSYKNLGLAKKDIKIEDKEIDAAVESLLKMRTEYKDFDGPVERGHHLEIDFTVTDCLLGLTAITRAPFK